MRVLSGLKRTPLPEAKRTLHATYRNIHAAADAVAAIMAQPITPCALELMGAAAIDMVRCFSDLGVPPETGALLMIEVDGLERLSRDLSIRIVNFGHAGNGNIHVNLLVNPDDPDEMRRAEQALSAVFDLVVALDGTLSGEHGVGLEKRDFVEREIDPIALRLMRDIKRQFDPNGILNPGKGLPLGE